MTNVRRVALLLGQDLGYCREVMYGVQAYALHRGWVFRDGPADPLILDPLRQWKPHGIIAHLFDAKVAEPLARMRRPVVNTTSTLDQWRGPLVETDHLAVGRLAAEYFLKRGFRQFGYFGSSWTGFSRDREAGFRRRLGEAGLGASSCYADYLPRPPLSASWRGVDEAIRRWLASLPKPVAVFASNDVPARDLADVCRHLELRVPDDVALLGVDNDELECRLTSPPLSSIDINPQRIGYEAAAMLDRLMRGAPVEHSRVLLPPVRVVTRQSTDTLAIEDADVSAALAFIRSHTAEPIGVEAILDAVPVSRRVLERKFRRLLGQTVLERIHQHRVEAAQVLLADTDLPMARVATAAGFSNARRLAVVFRVVTGLTPTEFRRRSQINGPER